MLVDLRELLSGMKEELVVDAHIDMSSVDTGFNQYDITGCEPFVLTINKIGKDKVKFSCSSVVNLSIPCDRCLEAVDTRIEFVVDETVDYKDNVLTDEDQEEKDYIDGYNLDVDKLVFGELLVSIPGKILCKEDCKGLCLVCGANLNVAECGCDRAVLDPRMSVFKDILNNFKEV